MVRLQIVSDGTAFGTKVTDEEGRPIEGIKTVSWYCDAEDGEARVTLEVWGHRMSAELRAQLQLPVAEVPLDGDQPAVLAPALREQLAPAVEQRRLTPGERPPGLVRDALAWVLAHWPLVAAAGATGASWHWRKALRALLP